MNDQVIKVNLIPNTGTPAVAKVSQYDVGRPLQFVILDGATRATLAAGTRVYIKGTKPSGLGFSVYKILGAGGSTIAFQTNLAMTQECGRIPCELRVVDGDDDIGTANFILAVEKTPHAEGTTDGTQETMQNLETRLQAEIDGLDDRIEALENAEESGLTEAIKSAMLQIARKVAYIDEHGQTYYDALYDALYPPANLVSISAVYTPSGTVYESDSLDSLKSRLVVTAHWSNGTTSEVASANYTLSGTLTMGTSTVTVSYGGMTTTFEVTVVGLTGITATYTQSGTVYDTDTLDSLKSDLVVTANYSDGTSETATDYTLSGTLTIGTSTITVSYGGKTASFNVTVTDYNAVDYTINPLDGITWHDGYTYNRDTGVLTATANEHCTDKFSAQSCIYILANADTTNNRYVAIFAWDENGAYLGELQYNASVFSLKREYKYALKVFNSVTFDSSTITFMPKNNTATAASEFEIKLSDYVGNITATNANYYEINVASVMSGAGVTADNIGTKINKCNHLAVLTPVSTTLNFVNRDFAFWFYNINTMLFRVKDIPMKDLTALESYIAANNPIVRFNY